MCVQRGKGRGKDRGWGLVGKQRQLLKGDAGMRLQHSPRREAMKRGGNHGGWGGGGGSVSDGELQPTHRAHAHAHIQTLWGKLTASHKSLSLTAVSD